MAEAATANSAPHERDARRVNARGDHDVRPGDIAIGVVIGRTSEYFDFFVYALASVIVFPALVFPTFDRLTATILSFSLFPLAFLARPIGTQIFMALDRRYGRGAKLTMALLLLGTSTVAIAFLPGHQTVGAASAVLLAAGRIGQGFAWGGTWDGLASLLALNAPDKRRGWWAMVPQIGAPLALLLASGLFAFFLGTLTPADFINWGWRYPFFVAFAINVVALFARLRIVVTPEYDEMFRSRELTPSRVPATLKAQWRNIVIGAFAPLASYALFHMVTVFPLSWVALFTQQSLTRFLMIEMAGAVICLLAMIASGLLADRIGRRSVLGYTAAAIAVFSGFAPQLLEGGEMGEIVFMGAGFLLLGLSFGQSSGAVTSNFPKRARYTGAAITSDLAWLFGAGFAPLVALVLAQAYGIVAAGAYLLSGALATLAALGLNKELARRLD
ncbi:MFS transporter [Sphingomonas jatrophae]|uniref:Sugar phosphate permease n=1 Tax=Sphingomonas jatrophae TaxID=1166337 RepID=A0A1I6JAD1_9SPHN|nr:MFS transporter [Sphingomonas jatrophae]SFR75957.1 Sugar phosphate permease [Sphingomonas jatrophae]